MTSTLSSPRIHDDLIDNKENRSDSPSRLPISNARSTMSMSLRPRTTKLTSDTRSTLHPSATSSVLASKRMRSPYERPRRPPARAKNLRRPRGAENVAPPSTGGDLDLGSLRSMSITQPKKTNAIHTQQQQQQQQRRYPSYGPNPTHMIAPVITSKGGRRKPPPANLMLDGGHRPQRQFQLPGFYPVQNSHQQDGQGCMPMRLQAGPVMRIPSFKTDIGTEGYLAQSGSFPSIPSLAYSSSIGSGLGASGSSGAGVGVGSTSGAGSGKMQVPVSLPRPPIMDVLARRIIKSDPDVTESIEHVRARLKTISGDLLRAAGLYRPQYPATMRSPHSATPTAKSSSSTLPSASVSDQFSSPSNLSTIKEDAEPPYSAAPITGSTMSSRTNPTESTETADSLEGPFDIMFDQTLSFGLTAEAERYLDERDGKGWTELAGCEPDCCLAVKNTKSKPVGCSEEEEKEYMGKMLPAHHLLYISHCANFPPRQGPALDESGFALPLNASYHHDPSTSDLPPIRTTTQLPLVHLSVPFPTQFITLHQYLYLPNPARLLSTLLALPPPIVLPGQTASKSPAERLATLPIGAIVERLRNIHKMWSNVVHLGIKDEMLWKAMERAWSVAIEASQARAKSTQVQQQHQQQQHARQNFTVQNNQIGFNFLSSQTLEAMMGPSLTAFPSGQMWPAQLVHGEHRPDPLPNHPKSAGISSTGHVMGLPSHDEGTTLAC